MKHRIRRWLGIIGNESHLREVEHELDILKTEVKFYLEEKGGELHFGSFGYSHPDKECPDWACEGTIAEEALNYRELGCICCDNLKQLGNKEDPPLRANEIHLRCSKGHTLIVGVLKEDEQ